MTPGTVPSNVLSPGTAPLSETQLSARDFLNPSCAHLSCSLGLAPVSSSLILKLLTG